MKYKWPKLPFFFGEDFGFLDFTIFGCHLSGDFPPNESRWGRTAGPRQTTALSRGNSGRGIQCVMFGMGVPQKGVPQGAPYIWEWGGGTPLYGR